jgi:hypothetical protein
LLESGESAVAEARAMIRHSRSNGFVVANFEKDHSLLSKMVLKLHPHADLENYAGFSDQWRLLIEFLKRVPASGFCPETLSPMVVVALEKLIDAGVREDNSGQQMMALQLVEQMLSGDTGHRRMLLTEEDEQRIRALLAAVRVRLRRA